MSIQLVLNGNDLLLIQNDKIIGVYDQYYVHSLGSEVERAILKALGRLDEAVNE